MQNSPLSSRHPLHLTRTAQLTKDYNLGGASIVGTNRPKKPFDPGLGDSQFEIQEPAREGLQAAEQDPTATMLKIWSMVWQILPYMSRASQLRRSAEERAAGG